MTQPDPCGASSSSAEDATAEARSQSVSPDECCECAVRPAQQLIYPFCSHACERSFRSRERWES